MLLLFGVRQGPPHRLVRNPFPSSHVCVRLPGRGERVVFMASRRAPTAHSTGGIPASGTLRRRSGGRRACVCTCVCVRWVGMCVHVWVGVCTWECVRVGGDVHTWMCMCGRVGMEGYQFRFPTEGGWTPRTRGRDVRRDSSLSREPEVVSVLLVSRLPPYDPRRSPTPLRRDGGSRSGVRKDQTRLESPGLGTVLCPVGPSP